LEPGTGRGTKSWTTGEVKAIDYAAAEEAHLVSTLRQQSQKQWYPAVHCLHLPAECPVAEHCGPNSAAGSIQDGVPWDHRQQGALRDVFPGHHPYVATGACATNTELRVEG
jgi:hypothetical protein